MARFNLNDYETVADRIARFYEDHPDGSILTELHGMSTDEHYVVQASLLLAGQVRATGWAEESVSSSGVNKSSALENAETSAVGRALANLGYAGASGKRPSREEMEKVERVEAFDRSAWLVKVQAATSEDELRGLWAGVPVGDRDACKAILVARRDALQESKQEKIEDNPTDEEAQGAGYQ